MKTRHGFVSNSSSSSFVVVLPDDFDIDKCINKKWSNVDADNLYDEFNGEEELDEQGIKDKLKKLFTKLKKGKLDFYEHSEYLYPLSELLEDYIVATSDTSSESGDMVIIDNKLIRKILNF